MASTTRKPGALQEIEPKDYRAVLLMREVAASGCPSAGELEGPDWTEARVTCRSCGATLGHNQVRRGRARLTIQCHRCRKRTIRVFPREWGPGLATALFDGI